MLWSIGGWVGRWVGGWVPGWRRGRARRCLSPWRRMASGWLEERLRRRRALGGPRIVFVFEEVGGWEEEEEEEEEEEVGGWVGMVFLAPLRTGERTSMLPMAHRPVS